MTYMLASKNDEAAIIAAMRARSFDLRKDAGFSAYLDNGED